MAVFVDGAWRGLADFVMRQPDGTYEVLDTKLARHTRPAHTMPASPVSLPASLSIFGPPALEWLQTGPASPTARRGDPTHVSNTSSTTM